MEPTSSEPSHHASAANETRLPESVHARRGILVRLAYRMLWNIDDAEDAVQNAMLLATRRHDQLADRSKLWSWLRSIVVRQCQDMRRAGVRHDRSVAAARDGGRTEASPVAGAEAERAEFSVVVRRLIGKLPERQRTALVLRHLEEMDYVEIASVMGINESTVRVHVRNAREGLRLALLERDPQWACRGVRG